MQDNKDKKKPAEKPVKIPMDFKEELAALLQTKPPKDDKAKQDNNKS